MSLEELIDWALRIEAYGEPAYRDYEAEKWRLEVEVAGREEAMRAMGLLD